jgi:hypothetical protein
LVAGVQNPAPNGIEVTGSSPYGCVPTRRTGSAAPPRT